MLHNIIMVLIGACIMSGLIGRSIIEDSIPKEIAYSPFWICFIFLIFTIVLNSHIVL